MCFHHLYFVTFTAHFKMSSSASPTNGPSSTLLATATALLAVTTPFIPPSACPTVYDITTFTSLSGDPSAFVSLLVSNPANENYVSCQPAGLSNVAPSLRQSFSPAVCPSGWWYNEMSTTVIGSRTISTATCCKAYVPHLPDVPTQVKIIN